MYRKILVPLDGSPTAEQVLSHVTQLADLTGAEIVLMTAALAHTFPGVDPTEEQVAVVHKAQDYLEGVAERLRNQGYKVSSHVRYGHDAEEILNHSELEEIDLVAMNSHGRTGIGRFLLGSVSKRVVRHCAKPVLIVRAKE